MKKLTAALSALKQSIIKPFLPRYEIVFSMYHVIPGRPIHQNDSVYPFDKGEALKAEDMFRKILIKNRDMKMVPSSVVMKKGKKIVKAEYFGPVQEIKMLMAS